MATQPVQLADKERKIPTDIGLHRKAVERWSSNYIQRLASFYLLDIELDTINIQLPSREARGVRNLDKRLEEP